MTPPTTVGKNEPPAAPCRRWSALAGLVDGLFFAALAILPLAWLADPLKLNAGPLRLSVSWGWKPVLAPGLLLLAGVVLRRRFAVRGLLGRPRFQKTALAVISIYLFTAAAEGLLAWRGYQAHLPPVILEGLDRNGGRQVMDTLPDPELIYRFKPGSVFQGQRINQLGFRDREVEIQKKPGTRRVLCLGDSVTGQGLPGYPQLLHARLQAEPPTPEGWEALNLGVHGYSVLQGLRLFERWGTQLQPDVVTIYYGWNGHWLSARSDRSQMGVKMDAVGGRLYERLSRKRLFMFLSALLNPVHRWRPLHNGRGYRVPPEEYRTVLGQLIDAVQEAGAVPVVITAPRRGLTEELVRKCYAQSVAQAEQIHDQYVELTRDEARRRGAVLLDLAALFAGPECDRYFAPDGIHFDLYPREHLLHETMPAEAQPGLTRIAAELHRTLQAVVRSPRWPARPPAN